ncbi:universal stress protein [Pseudomonas aeruginosa]|jgi:nucleotide-binding universal stress UspA family protein|uniref:universal stress protein n=1 Tax=Pseudomonas TaxID=286 RepID=UPI000E31F55C|nr:MULTISPECIES: universal stress protein [Pseudomonas]NLC02593.1 universal stress protein [Halopseudomonas formosensis]NPX49479.1 universal stress protein [Pseudomonas aeruginosa]NPY94555.1 universal stress protein [Pseudomonas aeruginosa]
MTYVTACIDGSACAPAVCDYAAWASQRLNAPLTFLHVLDQRQYPVSADLSGNIGLGSREHLLDELAALDEQRNKLALEQGLVMLAAAKERAIADGVSSPETRQRHGDLLESLRELGNDIRLLVIGRQGESSDGAELHVGSQLESVIRIMRRPLLVTPTRFKQPESAMLAFDGGATTRKRVEMLAASPLLKGLPIHLVMVGTETMENSAQMEAACSILASAGHKVHTAIRTGEVEPALHAYQEEHGVDLLVMGAYGHSRIRQFLVGSTTAHMLRTTTTPLLLLR